jgi:hypothetical protein
LGDDPGPPKIQQGLKAEAVVETAQLPVLGHEDLLAGYTNQYKELIKKIQTRKEVIWIDGGERGGAAPENYNYQVAKPNPGIKYGSSPVVWADNGL